MRYLETTHYFILLALAEGANYGYYISDQMIGDSVGAVYLRPSSLYDALKTLEKSGHIERLAGPEGKTTRKSYRLTEFGLRQLVSAAHMHERAARLSRSRLGARY